MTDAQNMLALARAVYPDAVIESEGGVVFVYGKRHKEFFDPILHDYQFVDVLAWLLNQRDAPADPLFTILDDDAPPVTAAGLRQAVTDAAVRVAGVAG